MILRFRKCCDAWRSSLSLTLLFVVVAFSSAVAVAEEELSSSSVSVAANTNNDLMDIDDFFNNNIDETAIPLFWHVPKAGGSSMKYLFQECFQLVMGEQAGYGNSMRLWDDQQHSQLINIDTTTMDGMDNVRGLEFHPVGQTDNSNHTKEQNNRRNAENGSIDLVVATRLQMMITNVIHNNNQKKKGILFTIIRHPIQRAASLFYEKQDPQSRAYDPRLQNMTLLEYFEAGDSHYHESIIPKNWMLKMLLRVGRKDPSYSAGEEEDWMVEEAKDVLRRFAFVGIFEELGLSVRRFAKQFHWGRTEGQELLSYQECVRKYVHEGVYRHPHPEIEQGTPVWNAGGATLKYDLELYRYAWKLFHDDQKWIEHY